VLLAFFALLYVLFLCLYAWFHVILMHDHNVAVMLYMYLLLGFIIYVLCCMCCFQICFVYCVFYAPCEANQH
jgi:hypothetical protein